MYANFHITIKVFNVTHGVAKKKKAKNKNVLENIFLVFDIDLPHIIGHCSHVNIKIKYYIPNAEFIIFFLFMCSRYQSRS